MQQNGAVHYKSNSDKNNVKLSSLQKDLVSIEFTFFRSSSILYITNILRVTDKTENFATILENKYR